MIRKAQASEVNVSRTGRNRFLLQKNGYFSKIPILVTKQLIALEVL